jgi:hypothetical protein
VTLRGGSATALADAYGRILDGDGDGHPGGDFEFSFELRGGAAP